MQIQFIAPFERAYNWMKSALFQPFELRTWMVIGFTAFLADLLDMGGGGSNGLRKESSVADWGTILSAPYTALDWLRTKPGWMMLIIAGVLAAAALILLFIWLSSRGKFMFLDNVVQRRALISQPWHQFRENAFSLFRWRIVFGVVALTLVGGTLYHVWRISYVRWNQTGDLWGLLPSLLLWLVFLILSFLVLAYVKLLLNHFVVPLMYKHSLTCTQAWDKLLPMHWRHFGSYLLYALFILAFTIALVVAVVIGGLFTCCLGFILLVIPYVSSVVLLPFSYWLRAFGLEFLAQFGDDFNLLPQQSVQEQNAMPQ